MNLLGVNNIKFIIQKPLLRSYTTVPNPDLRIHLDDAGKKLNINKFGDWYQVSNKDLENALGSTFATKFDSSPLKLLSSVYPEYDWLPWKFNKCPNNFWNDDINQRKYMDWMGKQLNYKSMADWYIISTEDFTKFNGRTLLRLYNNSYLNLLCNVYPEYEWLPWKFNRCTKYFWNDTTNQRKYMNWLGKELKYKEMSDWYQITFEDFRKFYGRNLLKIYNNSCFNVLCNVYPEYEWLPWKFKHCTKGFWDDVNNHKRYMDWVGKQLGIKEMSDWYTISFEDLRKLEGRNLLKLYNDSCFNLLCKVYPEYEWLPWKFNRLAKHFWNNINNQNMFMNWIMKELDVKGTGDLSQINNNVINEWLRKQQKSSQPLLAELLAQSFPDLTLGVSVSAKKSQYMLKECIEKLFIDESNKDIVLLEEYRHPNLIHMSKLELDYYIPQYNIAFEYHGVQHYRNLTMFHNLQSTESLRERDKQKSEICKELGITLIEVPYWWDRKTSSLAATVYNSRPDLFKQHPQGKAISLTPPEKSEIQSASKFLMTATEWEDDVMDPTGWMMTEKYDGMRLYWNGKEFLSRNGKIVKVPSSIVSQMPSSVSLDGELWTQYGLYQDAVGLQNTNSEEKWSKAIFWVFDSPQLEAKKLEERIKVLKSLSLPSFAKIIEFVKCESKEHLKQFSESVIAKGGEGVMLREPGSLYKSGRSTSLRRFKPFYDTEVLVSKNQYPHGFLCQQLNGKTLFVNTSAESLNTAKQIEKGSVITVKHSGMNKHGTLMFPQFYRQRTDVQWQDFVNK